MSRRFLPWRRMAPADLPPLPVRPATAIPPRTETATPRPPAVPPAPAPAPAGVTYTVTYDRVGQWGRLDGCPAPAPLIVTAATSGEIADAIARDVVSYLPAQAEVLVTVDLGAMVGLLRLAGRTVGTFDLRMHGGAR
jgi:hypothetical protein